MLEICVDSIESAIAAQRGGAQRIELCSALSEGGITPSTGLIALVRKKLRIGINVMIRPRGGDFCYSALEFDLMQQEIELARAAGANGIVLGILKADGTVDVNRTRKLVKLAAPLPVTFHRAIDVTRNLPAALEAIIDTGVVRVLTSGGAQNVIAGMKMIAKLVAFGGGRISIMPGSGVRPENIVELARTTGAREFHGSAGNWTPGLMQYKKRSVRFNDVPNREFTRYRTDSEVVRRLAQALKTLEK
ncbi:MAG: copper homeostasis protein CutC [Acidobacteriota bacterium]|nr:copper homeostasis protein CutC [Acidobacteriota bacterium]